MKLAFRSNRFSLIGVKTPDVLDQAARERCKARKTALVRLVNTKLWQLAALPLSYRVDDPLFPAFGRTTLGRRCDSKRKRTSNPPHAMATANRQSPVASNAHDPATGDSQVHRVPMSDDAKLHVKVIDKGHSHKPLLHRSSWRARLIVSRRARGDIRLSE